MAQQARPKVIHISEPVRAQLISSSAVVTRKPLSASASENSPKRHLRRRDEAPRPCPPWAARKRLSGPNPIRALPSATRRRSQW